MSRYESKMELTKNSLRPVNIRSAVIADAEQLLALSKNIFATSDFLVTQADEAKNMTIQDQAERIKRFIEGESQILIVAELGSEVPTTDAEHMPIGSSLPNGQIVGMIDFFASNTRRRISHVGGFGMSVHKDYRNQGIGSLLLKHLIEWVQSHPRIELIAISVLEGNAPAIEMYEKYGFHQTGFEPFGIKMDDGSYLANIHMSLKVK